LQNAFNIDMLWNPHDAPSTPGSYYPGPGVPRGKQPLRKDAPHNLPSPIYPRRPPADPTDIEDYINDVRGFYHEIHNKCILKAQTVILNYTEEDRHRNRKDKNLL